MLNFSHYPTSANSAIFAGAAIAVWVAGGHLVRQVDAIADKTKIGRAFAGMLLLGGITSLPEISAVSGASWIGNASLSISNLLGSLCINLVLLAIADAMMSRQAITSTVPGPETLLQGTLGIVALALTAGAIAVGDRKVFGVGLWSLSLLVFVVFAFWLSSRYATHGAWRSDRYRPWQPRRTPAGVRRRSPAEPNLLKQVSLARLCTTAAALSAIILVAGFTLSQTADAIARQTGLGSNFLGLVLVGFATALPNLSSIVGAVRIERFEMAISDVFGADLFNLGLIALADGLYQGGPILNHAGKFEIVAALLGLVLTAIFLMGLLEREGRTIFGMGYDSFAVLWIYFGGLALLYFVS